MIKILVLLLVALIFGGGGFGAGWFLFANQGEKHEEKVAEPLASGRPEAASAGGAIVAPMPGRIVRIHVTQGDDVAATQPLIVLEAMKMEHVIAAPSAGRVARLLVAVGDQVTRGETLAELAADGPEPIPTPERGA